MAAVSDTSDQSTFHWYNPFSWFVSDGEAVGDAAVDIANIDLDFKRVNRARSDALTKQGDPNLNSVRDQRPDPADAFKQADDAANVVKTGAMIAITIEASAGEFTSSAPDTGGGFGSAARTEANGVKKGGQGAGNAAEKAAQKAGRTLDDIFKNEELFNQWLKHKFPANSPFSLDDSRKIWDELTRRGLNPRLDPSHPGKVWSMPHINIPGRDIHIPVDPGFKP